MGIRVDEEDGEYKVYDRVTKILEATLKKNGNAFVLRDRYSVPINYCVLPSEIYSQLGPLSPTTTGNAPEKVKLYAEKLDFILSKNELGETFPPKGYEINYDHLKTSHSVLDDVEFRYWRHVVAEEDRRNMTVSERPNPCPINPIKEMYIDQCIKMSKIPTKRGYRQFRELRGI